MNLSGYVINDTGAGVNGATVDAIRMDTGAVVASTTTGNHPTYGQAGYWRFTGLDSALIFKIKVTNGLVIMVPNIGDSEVQYKDITLSAAITAGAGQVWNLGVARLVAPKGIAFPATPSEGEVFYRTDQDLVYVYDGVAWVQQKPTTPLPLAWVSITSAATPYTVAAWNTHVDVDASGGAVTVILPTAVDNQGKLIEVRKTDASANVVTIDASGAQTINRAATFSVTGQDDSYSLRSDGTNVVIV